MRLRTTFRTTALALLLVLGTAGAGQGQEEKDDTAQRPQSLFDLRSERHTFGVSTAASAGGCSRRSVSVLDYTMKDVVPGPFGSSSVQLGCGGVDFNGWGKAFDPRVVDVGNPTVPGGAGPGFTTFIITGQFR